MVWRRNTSRGDGDTSVRDQAGVGGSPVGVLLPVDSPGRILRSIAAIALAAAAVALPILAIQAFYQPVNWRNLLLISGVGLCYGSGYLLVFSLLLPRAGDLVGPRRAVSPVLALVGPVLAVLVGGTLTEAFTAALGSETAQHWWVGSAIVVIVRLVDLERAGLRRRTQEVELRAARAELAALRARVDPHFLFNSLNTVAGLIEEDPPRALLAVDRLAELYHHLLRSASAETVALRAELDAAEAYLDLQALRFEDRFRARIEVAEALRGVSVPSWFLQPLVENAVLHGAGGGGESEVLEIRVFAEREGGRLRIGVEDNGPGPGGSRHRGSGTSLGELERRLALAIGGRGRLVLGARPDGGRGFRAAVEFPEDWR